MINLQEREDLASSLERFLEGSSEDWEFDDLLYAPVNDTLTKKIIENLKTIQLRFPPNIERHFTSSEGAAEISEMIEILRTRVQP
ncbi:hypothetical protein [Sphingorhabdus lutea]|nr:hypothetical protein [Sphingorhabdus lutea]